MNSLSNTLINLKNQNAPNVNKVFALYWLIMVWEVYNLLKFNNER